ncbi:hypothetical protein Mycch_1655 [Mycolicibacterium chubuense NBB4]|uniref:Lipoprotein LppE n=1 Tax=Mycolicibacterium chubuense (strain NBB4) TaxID=710421 RepID=I4BGP2_MYCCN|nr:lipoprotein LpqH [Mycolicibacterium chubuense]AFM16449.1 hypothetical protein Mycch_1655 [Mycolicibacterium chubuense NBB4]
MSDMGVWAGKAARRWLLAALMISAAGLTGCSSSVQTAPSSHATLTVNGVTVDVDALRCGRVKSYLTVAGDQQQNEFTAVFDVSGSEPKMDWVKLRNVAGFSGDVWRGGVGDATAARRDDTYVVAGSAYGYFRSRPTELGVLAPFRIQARC